MLIVGAVGWALRMGPQLHVDASSLADLPVQIAGYRSAEVPLSSIVERELQADFNIQRAYAGPDGEVVWLYVGYYGTQSGGRPKHTPRGCYTGAGWGIESTRTIEVNPGGELRANEYLIEQSGDRRLVHFWYRSHRRTGILGGLDQNIDRLLGRLIDGRADGALIRLSTPIASNDVVTARDRLISFAGFLDPLIAEHWPLEIRCEDASPDVCPSTSRSDETNSDETSATDAEDRSTADLVTSDGDIAELPSVPSTAEPAV